VSNVIDLLERFGEDAELRYASGDEVEAALRLAGIEPALRAAIVNKDQGALELLLGADANVCCILEKIEEEEENEEEEDDDEEEEEEDAEKDMMPRKSIAKRVA
jgi:hypothetical protein